MMKENRSFQERTVGWALGQLGELSGLSLSDTDIIVLDRLDVNNATEQTTSTVGNFKFMLNKFISGEDGNGIQNFSLNTEKTIGVNSNPEKF